MRLATFFSTVIVAVVPSVIGGQHRLRLRVAAHGPCRGMPRNWRPSIEFGDSKSSPLVADVKRLGCYSMTGRINITRPLGDKLQIYLEATRSGQREPESCIDNEPKTGCGGIGSCVYCENCRSLGSKRRSDSALTMQLKQYGKPLKCNGSTLAPGQKDDLELSFCMQTEKDFARVIGFDEEAFRAFRGDDSTQTVRFKTYIFDSSVDVAAVKLKEQEAEEDQKRRKGRPLTLADRSKLPMQQLLRKGTFIGCHQMLATIVFDDTQQSAALYSVFKNG